MSERESARERERASERQSERKHRLAQASSLCASISSDKSLRGSGCSSGRREWRGDLNGRTAISGSSLGICPAPTGPVEATASPGASSSWSRTKALAYFKSTRLLIDALDAYSFTHLIVSHILVLLCTPTLSVIDRERERDPTILAYTHTFILTHPLPFTHTHLASRFGV